MLNIPIKQQQLILHLEVCSYLDTARFDVFYIKLLLIKAVAYIKLWLYIKLRQYKVVAYLLHKINGTAQN